MPSLAELWFEEGFQNGIQQGEQRGIQQGMQQGIQQGIQRGMQQGEYSILIRQLERKFDIIPESYRQCLMQADTQTLLLWADRILEAHTLDEVFEESEC